MYPYKINEKSSVNMAKNYPKLGSILKKLLFEKDIKSADLARAIDLPPPTIHRLVTGKSTRPYKSSLEPIADYFSISIEQLVGEEPLEEVAQKHIDASNQLNITPAIKQIPLIEWQDVTPYLSKKDSIKVSTQVFADPRTSDDAFALTVQDAAMDPYIPKGSIIIVDPKKPTKDRCFVLVKLGEDNSIIFRQLLIDGSHQFLQSVSPALSTSPMRLVKENDEILATLVEFRHRYED